MFCRQRTARRVVKSNKCYIPEDQHKKNVDQCHPRNQSWTCVLLCCTWGGGETQTSRGGNRQHRCLLYWFVREKKKNEEKFLSGFEPLTFQEQGFGCNIQGYLLGGGEDGGIEVHTILRKRPLDCFALLAGGCGAEVAFARLPDATKDTNSTLEP